MKILLFFLLMGCGLLGFSQQSQHLTVMTHDHLTVTTNREGLNKFARWAQFPKKGLPIRKVLMHVTLGCPDSIPCAHWDYLDHITLLRSGGMQGKNCQLELGRLITPYGSQFKRGWHFTWTTDVTDFKQELRDSVLVEYAHSGWEPQNVGWSLTILFEIFAGRSVIETDSIHRLWQGSFLYGDSAKSIEERLGPMYFESKTSKSSFRLRIQQTGHGMDSPGNCSEFCPRWRKLLLDGKSFDQKNIWKECGDNPLYPQGGTWVYDRGGWCPGDLPPADCYDIIVGKGNHRLDLTMQPYKATGSPQAAENIAAYLMAYKGPFAKNDVALESILVPNEDALYGRLNPAGSHPRLVIRNLGKKVLKRLNIVYGTEGFASRTYLWRGLLPFNETTTVTLPGKIDFMEGKNLFRVKLVGPNEHLDEWTDDNQSVTIFYAPPRLPADMVLAYRTNLRPAENKLIIRNQDSLVVYRRDSIGTVSNKRYMDTLHLQPGVYELMLSDAKGDGMEFWAEKEQGFGFLRMMDLDGHLLKNFESDCGKGIFYSFSVDPRYIWLEEKNPPVFILYPKRTKDNLTISYCLNRSATLELLIVSESGQKENYKFDKVKDGEAVLPVKHLGKGKYTLEAFENGFRRFSSRFTVEE